MPIIFKCTLRTSLVLGLIVICTYNSGQICYQYCLQKYQSIKKLAVYNIKAASGRPIIQNFTLKQPKASNICSQSLLLQIKLLLQSSVFNQNPIL